MKEEIRWSYDLAYAVGLIATDGNLSKDGRHLEFCSKDLELVTTFKHCLRLDNRIGWKTSGTSARRYPHVQFGNVRLYRWLLQVGLTPRKSLTLSALRVPRKFFPDFLRGCLDGDGCVRAYKDPVYPRSQRLYTFFYSGSRPFLEWIRQKLHAQTGLTGYLNFASRCWRLGYAQRESRRLLALLYRDPRRPCLQRKRARFLGILSSPLAEVVELADTYASGAYGASHRGSNPRLGTISPRRTTSREQQDKGVRPTRA